MKKTIKKRAFISAIAMLIVSAIVLTSSTFAWFSMAKKVEVESMKLSITSPEGIQLSANAKAWTTTITKAELEGQADTAYARFNAYDGNTNYFPSVLSPASSIFHYTASTKMPEWYSGSINADGKLITTKITADNASTACYVSFDLFVKLAEAQKVGFEKSTITCETNPEAVYAMCIATVNCGQVTDPTDTVAMASLTPTSQNSTVTTALGRRNNYVVYELDSLNHTAASGLTSGTVDSYRQAIKAAGEVTPIKPVEGSSLSANISPLNSGITGNTYAELVYSNSSSEAYFNAYAGITKIRVYIWMEGQDSDCANDVAGQDIDVNFVLTIA